MGKYSNLVGQTFDWLFAEEYLGKDKNREDRYKCLCKCGNYTTRSGRSLCDENFHSCGCHYSERAKRWWAEGKMDSTHSIKHGMAHSNLYKTWGNIKGRCFNSNHPLFVYYGGRGITMCDEWKNDFMMFYQWAINAGYHKGLTIDRIDNDGNYCPENCRWVTMKEQSINKRNTMMIEFNGVTKSLKEWSDELGFKREVLRSRLNHGWTIEEALTTPSNRHNKRHRRK